MKQILILFTVALGLTAKAQKKDQPFEAYEQMLPGGAVKFKMVPVKGGEFKMGSPAKEAGREEDEGPQKVVKISPFWMEEHEVTYDEFNVFVEDQNFSQNENADAVTRPSTPYIELTLGMGQAGGYPANSMQQYGALMYCRWLYQKTGIFYRLPTEAEWEYACRAGSGDTWFFGNDAKQLDQYAWYKNNSKDVYHQVKQLKPNAWGLYDMLGNVGEWVLDQYTPDYFQVAGTTDPLVKPDKRHPRTVKGGSYRDEAVDLRPANRLESDPVWNRRDPQVPKSKWWNADAPFIGFRLVRPVKQPSAQEAEEFFKLYLGK